MRLAESAWEVAEQHGLEAELALAEALLTALREQSGNGGPERE